MASLRLSKGRLSLTIYGFFSKMLGQERKEGGKAATLRLPWNT
jgi:hypothetical protein